MVERPRTATRIWSRAWRICMSSRLVRSLPSDWSTAKSMLTCAAWANWGVVSS